MKLELHKTSGSIPNKYVSDLSRAELERERENAETETKSLDSSHNKQIDNEDINDNAIILSYSKNGPSRPNKAIYMQCAYLIVIRELTTMALRYYTADSTRIQRE